VPLSLDQGFFFFGDIENWQSLSNILPKLVKFILGKKKKFFQKFHNYLVQKTTSFRGKKTSGLDTLPCSFCLVQFLLNNLLIESTFEVVSY